MGIRRSGGLSMEQAVALLCGVWFWLTRRWRVDVYCAAAETLELAHAYLQRDFAAHASTRDRGILSPQQTAALALLQDHAVKTYVAATRMAKLRDCCRFVAEEMSERSRPAVRPVPRPASVVVLRPTPVSIRVRLAANRVLRFSVPASSWLTSCVRFLRAESSGFVWQLWRVGTGWRVRSVADAGLAAKPAEQPLKAA